MLPHQKIPPRYNQRRLSLLFGKSDAWVSQNIWRLIGEGFPRPIRGTERRPCWDAEAVDAWFDWREEISTIPGAAGGNVVPLIRPGALRAAVAGARK